MTQHRLRFAPSPTGYLHIGGARTALFNWLFARKHGGTFILRIEDTDQARSTDESVNAIFDAMKWLGLDWDEGPGVGGESGPYFQTQRLHIYKEYAEKLIAKGAAYRSYETKEDLELARTASKERGDAAFRYDSPWRDRTDGPKEKPHVVRFRMPRTDQPAGWDDLVYGHIEKKCRDMDDWIMIRPDGIPTYNYGAAIDDMTMGITVVARGDDHVNNTPPQLLVYEALGMKPPDYAHLPMILGSDKTRLSKRHGAVSVTNYRDEGYLPHALVNYLARLGWSHGDQEIFSRKELIDAFGFDHVGKTAGVFNPEKLQWLNNHWMRQEEPGSLADLYIAQLARSGSVEADRARATRIVELHREKAKTVGDIVKAVPFFYTSGVTIDDKAGTKELLPSRPHLAAIRERLQSGPFEIAPLEAWLKEYAETNTLKLGKVAQPLRVAVTGNTVSPPIFDTLLLIGKDECVRRLDAALAWIDARAAA